MSRQVQNPYLPLWEYVADGEPHVFGNRLYIYGSHDAFGGKVYCEKDYVCWSAPVDDLGNWHYEGVIFRKKEDPKNRLGLLQLWAPDVMQGADGRYYLYYCTALTPRIGVAVCDTPAGKYKFLGYLRHSDGTLYGKKEPDLPFDPGVLADNGRYWVYTGIAPADYNMRTWPRRITGIKITGDCSYILELQPDMLTVISQREGLPGPNRCKGTDFEDHAFFEASSMRKFNGKYYYIYSSVLSHELCWAVSDLPDRNFRFGGILHSNCNLGLNGSTSMNYPWGNNHGSIEKIGSKYYVFGHRQTNYTEASRQGVAEEIELDEQGNFCQVETTSCGLNGKPLRANEQYSAGIACVLHKWHATEQVWEMGKNKIKFPMITQGEKDGVQLESQYITNISDETIIGYKYFDFQSIRTLELEVQGTGFGRFQVYQSDPESCIQAIGEIPLEPDENWTIRSAAISFADGTHPLYLKYIGNGLVNLKAFRMS